MKKWKGSSVKLLEERNWYAERAFFMCKLYMQQARRLSGLTKNKNQGGGNKKQGLPSTVGHRPAMFLVKRKTHPSKSMVLADAPVCESLPTDTPYQTCAPWPHFGGLDNTNSRYTPRLGSQTGSVLTALVPTTTNYDIFLTSPVIDRNGVLYLVKQTGVPNVESESLQSYMVAYYPNGTLKWETAFNPGDSINMYNIHLSPVIGKNGTVFVSSLNGYVYAFNENGSFAWTPKQYATPFGSSAGSVSCQQVALQNDRLYFGANTYIDVRSSLFCASASNGDVLWSYELPDGSTVESSLAIDDRQHIYFIYKTVQNQSYLLSIDGTTHQPRYAAYNLNNQPPVGIEFFISDFSNPVLSTDNALVFVMTTTTVVVQIDTYYTFNCLETVRTSDGQAAFGTLRFEDTEVNMYKSIIARDLDNRVYFFAGNANNNNILYGVKNGAIVFTYNPARIINVPLQIYYGIVVTAPAIGADGTIYFTSKEVAGVPEYLRVAHAVRPDGVLKWRKQLPFGYDQRSVSLGYDGTVYCVQDTVVDSEGFPIRSTLYSIL